jgi:hypothetical protein
MGVLPSPRRTQRATSRPPEVTESPAVSSAADGGVGRIWGFHLRCLSEEIGGGDGFVGATED